jgi:hypothetical protein
MSESTEPGVVPGDRKAYIVFEGRPRAFYPHEDSVQALRMAEEYAAEMCETHKENDWVMMCVPVESLEFAIVAQYRGVRLVTLREAEREEG